eukprot:g1201.t1
MSAHKQTPKHSSYRNSPIRTVHDFSLTPHRPLELNVGGTFYWTTYRTLSSSLYFRSILSSETFRPSVDSHGRLFIDRDGSTFRFLLNFLRSGDLPLLNSAGDYQRLASEAAFFGLHELEEHAKAKLSELSEKEAMKKSRVEMTYERLGKIIAHIKLLPREIDLLASRRINSQFKSLNLSSTAANNAGSYGNTNGMGIMYNTDEESKLSYSAAGRDPNHHLGSRLRRYNRRHHGHSSMRTPTALRRQGSGEGSLSTSSITTGSTTSNETVPNFAFSSPMFNSAIEEDW